MEFVVRVSNMRLMRNQVENVRAVFDAQVGPFVFANCYLMGKLHDKPSAMRICLPGKRSEGQTKWVPTVICSDAELLAAIREKALEVFQGLNDATIERYADLLIGQRSGKIVGSFLRES